MLSIVCVYNNKETFNRILLKSLEEQSTDFELIALDNRDGRFKSAAEALNEGGRRSKGKYIVFAHQDMWFTDPYWVSKTEALLNSIPALGIAGVAGVASVASSGDNKNHRAKRSMEVFDKPIWDIIGKVDKPTEVQTLDECLLIVPSTVFKVLKFDERNFDGWDCYGADYCLSAFNLGLKTYVIPIGCCHSTNRSNRFMWEFPDLLKYQRRLYKKHGKKYKTIQTYITEINRRKLLFIQFVRFFWPFYKALFPIYTDILKAELKGCKSVLDLGCGHFSPISKCETQFSIGVDRYEPSLFESARIGTHDAGVIGDVREIEFKSKSVDAVVAVEILEKLTKEEGLRLIEEMHDWARKKIIIVTPNGNLGHKVINQNPYQEQKSVWSIQDFHDKGFKVAGVSGLIGYKDNDGLLKTSFIRTRISYFLSRALRHLPRFAMKLMATKQVVDR